MKKKSDKDFRNILKKFDMISDSRRSPGRIGQATAVLKKDIESLPFPEDEKELGLTPLHLWVDLT